MQQITQRLTADSPTKWLFYGDSITHGAVHTYGQRDYVELFAERIRYELDRPDDVIINTAASGATTRILLAGFDWRVKQFKPHVVFIMIGTNDCADHHDINRAEFEANLHELIGHITDLPAQPVLQTTCPILPGGDPSREPHIEDFTDAIRTVADSRNLPLIDHDQH